MRLMTDEYEKFKQTAQQSERTIAQLRRENDELQQKVTRSVLFRPCRRHEDSIRSRSPKLRNVMMNYLFKSSTRCEVI